MIPTTRAVQLGLVWLVIALMVVYDPRWTSAFVGCGVAFGVALLLDALLLLRSRPILLRRTMRHVMFLDNWDDVSIRIENQGAGRLHLLVFDAVPVGIESDGLPLLVTAGGFGWTEVAYRVRPQMRGDMRFGRAHARLQGRLGLLWRSLELGEEESIRVVPNFRPVAHYALLALDNRLQHLGIHLRRRRGEGLEFFQLREYRDGDSLRQIDWKATSRRRKLISREFQIEQNQQVVFLLDCGRRMHAKDGPTAHFDQVLNAVLLLTYVATRQGDSVGLLTFSGADRWLPPMKGKAAMNAMLSTIYDLQTGKAPSDYAEAVQRLSVRQRRRALVILLTNLRDDDASDLPLVLSLMRRRHLPLLASLRESALDEALSQPISGLNDALRASAAHRYLDARQATHDAVRTRGAVTLDVLPQELPVALVNRYLEIKRTGML